MDVPKWIVGVNEPKRQEFLEKYRATEVAVESTRGFSRWQGRLGLRLLRRAVLVLLGGGRVSAVGSVVFVADVLVSAKLMSVLGYMIAIENAGRRSWHAVTTDICEPANFQRRLHLLGHFLPPKSRVTVWAPAVDDLIAEWAQARIDYSGRIERWWLNLAYYWHALCLMIGCFPRWQKCLVSVAGIVGVWWRWSLW